MRFCQVVSTAINPYLSRVDRGMGSRGVQMTFNLNNLEGTRGTAPAIVSAHERIMPVAASSRISFRLQPKTSRRSLCGETPEILHCRRSRQVCSQSTEKMHASAGLTMFSLSWPPECFSNRRFCESDGMKLAAMDASQIGCSRNR